MVGSNGTMIAIRLVRSKLRKREEHSNSVHPVADVVLQTATAATQVSVTAATVNNQPNSPPQVLQTDLTYRGQFLWTQPPPPATQYLYNHDQDTLVQNLPTERPGFVRGFRKNLGGRWRRLVKRKPPTEVYTIPAELKPQLKQIYVY
ncbi:hypothetical protein NQ315_012699 [Exocentrus adspersus]|uniref:Uncharacterized protein n=1 Tax=Exocentrus adspersus TaxID=1586481 RepID=A0AAV8VSA9_9CUCU|nr:hypothetical protein NQ315_012699 [Exocentrus adspersus]